MIYDKTPHPYAHFEHLPLAKEPLKAIYVFQRLFTTVFLVPYWVAYYAVLPRKHRPRASWGMKQIVYVNFTRRIYKVVEVAGVTFNTRDPESEPDRGALKETRFEWAPPLDESLREGVIVDVESVPFKKVGMFIWPRVPPVYHDDAPIVGIFMHGGGYCQMSAHENARTSHIPRRLMKDGKFSEIYNVEYRLLQHAPFPAVIIDGATVYAHVLKARPNAKIVLIGDSSGGNLVLALARWIRDNEKLSPPAGLLLLSPSCDTSHAFPDVPSAYVARPHADTDYLTDTPEPRALLQRTFLGFKHRPKNVGWMPLKRDGSDQMDRYLKVFSKFRRRHKHEAGLANTDEDEEIRAEIEEETRRLTEIIHSEYVSPASPKVLRRWGHDVDLYDGGKDGTSLTLQQLGIDPGTPISELPPSLRPETIGLFAGFPKSMIVCGDAERLTIEVGNLSRAMARDGVDLQTRWVKDAVHDVLMIPPGWWDDEIRDEVWGDIGKWLDTI